MKDKIVRLRHAIASGQFPLYALAVVGILFIPPTWVPPLVVAMLIMHGLSCPHFLNEDYSKFWRQRDVQRIGVIGLTLWLFALVREQTFVYFDEMRRAWHVSVYGGIASPDSLIQLAMIAACLFAVAACAAVAQFPKVRSGREYEQKLQRWTDRISMGFKVAGVGMLAAFCLPPGGIVDMVTGWLLSSLRDANLWDSQGIQFSVSLALRFGALFTACVLFDGRIKRVACFMTALCRQIALTPATKLADTIVQVFRAPRTVLKIRDQHPFLKNVCASFWYLGFWYVALFWLCGLSPEPLSGAITNWLMCSVRDANAIPSMHFMGSVDRLPPDGAELDRLRMFLGAIVALYGTVPVAIMSSAFLPYAKRKELHLTADGAVFPDAAGIGGRARQIVLWTDFAEVDLKRRAKKKQGKIVFRFHSGGKFELAEKQLDLRSLDKLLHAIDEHAANCVVSDAVVALRAEIRAKIAIDGKEGELDKSSAQNFQSTIFVPHDLGAWLPSGEARVVRLLASRPLSCVYLVRLNSGQLAIAKQFFLADDNDQTRALRKTFQREYELLQKIEHPRIAKILDVFDRDESTYLLIEHAAGKDLRRMVEDEGPQPESVVLDWALQVCDILISLHSQDPPIVHRDLTPDNLVLAEDGSVRIIDFGAAHQFMEGVTGTIIGKQSYVPPEQLQGQAGPASDVYAFGCTLHFLLTGEEPKTLTQCEPQRRENVSDEINSLVKMCTEFDVAARPQTFTEVRGLLESLKQSRTPDEVLRRFSETLVEIRAEQTEQVPVEWK